MYTSNTLIHKKPIFNELNKLIKIETDINKINDMQHQKLKEILYSAQQNVPVYKDLIKNYKTIVGIPKCTKEMIIDNYENFISDKVKTDNVYVNVTDGANGKSLNIIRDNSANLEDSVNIVNVLYKHGIHENVDTVRGLRILTIDSKVKSGFYEIPDIPTALYCVAFVNLFTSLNEMDLCENIIRYSPELLSGKPSEILYLESLLNKNNKIIETIKYIITYGENLPKCTRNYLENKFNAKVINVYKLDEVGMVAFECPNNPENFLINESNVLIEHRMDFSSKEVVITSLENYTMPLINYKTGDMASIFYKKNSETSSVRRVIKDLILQGHYVKEATGSNFESLMKLYLKLSEMDICWYQIIYENNGEVTLRIIDGEINNKEDRILEILALINTKDLKVNITFTNIENIISPNHRTETFLIKEVANSI